MAKKKAKRSRPKKAAKKKAARRGGARTKARAKARPKSRPKARKAAASRPSASPAARLNVVTHTELASTDPDATRAWCATALGWKFGDAMPTPAGPYHMWRFANGTGGGIRANNPPEPPGSIPYVEVADIRKSYAKAIEAGAHEMMAPEALPGGMGWIAIVAAPGGVPIGFWAMK